MLTLVMLVAAILQGGTPSPARDTVNTIAKGADSGIDSARQVTVRTPEAWAALWREHAPDRAVPQVDFAREMVVGVFLGSRPTAGFGVEIVGTRQEGGALIVMYRETSPGRDSITAQILTAPYHLAAVPAFAGEVRFEQTAAKF
jgi:hypothetical protein